MTAVPPAARSLAASAVLGLLLAAHAAAQAPDSGAASLSPPQLRPEEFRANERPTLNVRRATGPIVVDGRLVETTWRHAARAANFCQIDPPEQARPDVGTEVLVAYDDTNLYLGFKAYDDPRAVRATPRAARDAIAADDWVGIRLDPAGDSSWAYEIYFNPLGAIADSLRTPAGTDAHFALALEAKGCITTDGYQVEAAIPFANLHLPERDVQNWRATFLRSQPRQRRRLFSWAAIDPAAACFSCRFGTLAGIRGLRSSARFNILDPIPDLELGWR